MASSSLAPHTNESRSFEFRSLSCWLGIALGLWLGGLASAAPQNPARPPRTQVALGSDTGEIFHGGSGRQVLVSFPVHVPGAKWMRLKFGQVLLAGDTALGNASTLRITSHLDGGTQELDLSELVQWRNSSAYFNGDTLEVEVLAYPHTGINRVVVDSAISGGAEINAAPEAPDIPLAQCGPADDRVLSTDPRSARLLPAFCTGALIDDCKGCFLTAGHCMGEGELEVAQFNVPPSFPNGVITHPPPADQYAIDPSSLQGANGGVGADWAAFGCFPNSETGLSPLAAQGSSYGLSLPPPIVPASTVRVTGYGTDSSRDNYVLQTSSGAYLSGTNVLEYEVDTFSGNSGSLVVSEVTGAAIGIHTHAGCSQGGGSGNQGTPLTNKALQEALTNPRGVCASPIGFPLGRPDVLQPGVPTDLQVSVGTQTVPGSPMLHLRYDGGDFIVLPMTPLMDDVYLATLPPATCGAQPEYYISVQSSGCVLFTSPAGAPLDCYEPLVGTPQVLFADDFEADRGWVVSNDVLMTGAWERGDPNGSAGQPEDDNPLGLGTSCFFTGQGSPGGQAGEADVDGGPTRLTSPWIRLSGGDTLIRYNTWIYSDDGDDRLLVEISDDGASWLEIASLTGSGGWSQHDLRVEDILQSSAVQLRFSVADQPNDSITEAAIDDVCTLKALCDPELADCNANGILDSDDIASSRSKDRDGNGIPDECVPPPTNYCKATANSTGLAARMSWRGSTSVAANDLILSAHPVPVDTGIFVYSPDRAQLPLGNGNLCVGWDSLGFILRLAAVMADPAGRASHLVDLTAPPVSSLPIVPGSTWDFTYWYRDHPAGGSEFNFSDGIEIHFVP